jgi:predicted nucleic acid-binding protein
MTYVLGCSFCAALFLPNAESERVYKSFCKIQEDDEVIVPVLWWQEMSTVLSASVGRERLKVSDVLEITRLLSAYRIITDVNYGDKYMEKTLGISRLYGISPANASYLELGLRKKGVIGTLSGELKNVCAKVGLMTL